MTRTDDTTWLVMPPSRDAVLHSGSLGDCQSFSRRAKGKTIIRREGEVTAVCSARPRPSVQKGAKGHQWWKRDVWHIAVAEGRTACGIDASEWIAIGQVAMGNDCCERCRRFFDGATP